MAIFDEILTRYTSRTLVLSQNDFSNGIYFITKGIIYITKIGIPEYILKINNTTFFGEQCLLDSPLKYSYEY